MKTISSLFPFLLALALSTALGLVGCDNKSNAPQGDLQSAIKARTEVTEPKLEVVKTDREVRDQVAAVPGPKPQISIDLGGGVTMDFVLIRPGSFMMGSDSVSSSGIFDEKPVHKVTLTKPFYLGKFEVTQDQWQAVMGSNPSQIKGPKLPVENLSWNDCQSFLTKLQEKLPGQKFALPTEAQWEYACRAGSTTKFSYGDDESNLGEHAWFYGGQTSSTTHPVGGKKPNAWGLHDMHGNVWEWCADWYANYPVGDATDPQGVSSGTHHVYRGGAWFNPPDFLRSSARSYGPTLDFRYGGLGLRLLLGVEPVR